MKNSDFGAPGMRNWGERGKFGVKVGELGWKREILGVKLGRFGVKKGNFGGENGTFWGEKGGFLEWERDILGGGMTILG